MPNHADEGMYCYGRIVWVDAYGSTGNDTGKESHPAIILDDDDTVREVREGSLPQFLFVVFISHDQKKDPPQSRMPVFPRWFLTGFIQGKWVEQIPLAAIRGVHSVVANDLEMEQVEGLVRLSKHL